MKLRERAARLTADIPAVFLALSKRETPWYAKAVAGLIVVYALSPVDLIPDFIPVLGYLDDLLILPALIALLLRLIPGDIFAKCRAEAEAGAAQPGKKRWYYAVPFVLIWALLLIWIIRAAVRALQ